jgi:hypothetical protein
MGKSHPIPVPFSTFVRRFSYFGEKQEHDGNGSSPMATGPETVELISCLFLRLPAFSQDNPVFDPIFWVLGSRAMAQRPACLVHSRSPSNIQNVYGEQGLTSEVVLLLILWEVPDVAGSKRWAHSLAFCLSLSTGSHHLCAWPSKGDVHVTTTFVH